MRQRTINLVRMPDGSFQPARVGLGAMETAMRSMVLLGRYRLGAGGMVPAAQTIQGMVAAAAAQFGVDPALALAVAQQESGFNQNRISSAGAIGVMQLEPTTAAGLGVDPRNLQQNISGGVKYLAQQLAQFGDPAEAVAAYNAGPSSVMRAIVQGGPAWLSLLPSETQAYVPSVLSLAGGSYVAAYQAQAQGSSGATETTPAELPPALIDSTGITAVDSTVMDASAVPLPTLGLDTNTLLLLGALAIGGYLLMREL
jgi:hypothetical protein